MKLDNKINQTILSVFMKKRGIKCEVAVDGDQAVEKWKKGSFHLVLVSLLFPIWRVFALVLTPAYSDIDGYPTSCQGWYRSYSRDSRTRASEQCRNFHHNSDYRSSLSHVWYQQSSQQPRLSSPSHARHHCRPHRFLSTSRSSQRSRRWM